MADFYNDGEFRVEGTTVTHLSSGAWWTFNFNSPNPYRSNTKNLDRPMTVTDIAKGIWALHLRTPQNDSTRVANGFSSQATL
jgi:hypothetical protein